MKRTILIPLDGSSVSGQILSHVTRNFDPDEARLLLVYVAEFPEELTEPELMPVVLPKGLIERTYEPTLDPEWIRPRIYRNGELASLQGSVPDEVLISVRRLEEAGYTISLGVLFGDPAEEIVRIAGDENVDLIAMTTHGRSGLSRLLMGSVAESVLRRTSIPVLLVRATEE